MKLLHRRPEKAEVWEQFALEVGGRFVLAEGPSDTEEVRFAICRWPAILDTHHIVGGHAGLTYTRMRAFYISTDRFEFGIHRKRPSGRLGRQFSMRGVRLDDPELSRRFAVRANDVTKARDLLGNPTIRELVLAHPEIDLSNGRAVGPKYPADVSELSAEVHKEITDPAELLSLRELVEETLHQLCGLGSASEEDPKLQV